ncbi:MAG: uroporphyrinogen-III synthase, partial [Dehalococcoidia bacterium]
EKEGSLLPWDKVAGIGTIVFLMGMDNLSTIVEELIKHGRPSSTPIALIRWGASPQQQTLEGTLADIVKKADEIGFAPPVVGVVGDVVKLREKLRWYDNKPLFGKRVLVTRSRKQASALSALLAQEGAEPVELPTIEIKTIEENRPLREAIGHIDKYHWLIFTSANGVEAFFKALKDTGKDVRALARVRTCAIGPATADAVEELGLVVDLIPEDYLAEGILETFGKKNIKGARFLLPRAEGAREALAEGLRKLGAEVEEVSAYRAVSPTQSRDAPLEMLLRGEIDIVTFTSSSTASNLAQMLNGRLEALEKPLIACIGPITAATARKLGLRVDVMASEHTVPGLVKALKEAVSANG